MIINENAYIQNPGNTKFKANIVIANNKIADIREGDVPLPN